MILGVGTLPEILLTVAVYMIALVVVTDLFKGTRWTGGKALLLSWGIGVLIFAALILGHLIAFNLYTIALYIVLTGATNSVYRWTGLKNFLKRKLGSSL